LIPNPSWPNHKNVISRAGLNFQEYRYYDFVNKTLDFENLLLDLDKAQNNSIVLLHVCAHNPTGMDPNKSQWEEICRIVRKKQHFPFFDMAYQGYATGDVDNDAYALRLFHQNGIRFCLAQSFAKNMGLYGHRVGAFSLVCENKIEAEICLSQLKFLARSQYSNPSKFGATVADIILSDKELTQEWLRELKLMANRISTIRRELYNNLIKAGSRLPWNHITDQIGMFAFTGLTYEQSKLLRGIHHIYLTDDGRISISGLNTTNVEYVAQAFHLVTQHNTVETKQNKS